MSDDNWIMLVSRVLL